MDISSGNLGRKFNILLLEGSLLDHDGEKL